MKIQTSYNYFSEERLAWIREIIEIYGFINRAHIMKKFRVSVAQASCDLRKAAARAPDLILYNHLTHRYEYHNDA